MSFSVNSITQSANSLINILSNNQKQTPYSTEAITPTSYTGSDYVSISEESKEKYLAMRGQTESETQTANSNTAQSSSPTISKFQEIFQQFFKSDSNTDSITQKVSDWHENEFKSGEVTSSEYSKWLPENYQKFKELTESGEFPSSDPSYESKLRMVFDALGKDKVITNQDISEGIEALTQKIDSWTPPTTIEESNFKCLTQTGISQLQANHNEEVRKAEEMLSLWEEKNKK